MFDAFSPLGSSYAIAVSTTISIAVQPTVRNDAYPVVLRQYRLIVAPPPSGQTAADIIFLGVGSTEEEALANAMGISLGASGPAVPLVMGTDEILSFPPGSYIAAITASGSAILYITPGAGI